MTTKLIRLSDGILIEVEAQPNEVQQISSTSADKVRESLEKIRPILVTACKPIVDAWRELNKDLMVDQAEVEIGLGFEGEGNIYITRAKANANITIKITLKPKA